MNKPNVTTFFKTAQRFASKHSPEILTGIGIFGMVTTTVLAVRATPKALWLIEEAKDRQNNELVKESRDNNYDECAQIDHLKPVEVIKIAWRFYIPAVITGVMSISCLIGASSVNARRTAALYSAYKLSETALSEYKEKMIETIGEEKEQVIKNKIAEERVTKKLIENNPIIFTGKGETQFFDPLSGRYFYSEIEFVNRAVNELNKTMIHDIFGYVSLNDFYDEIGLDHINIGEDLGWNTDHLIDIDFGSTIGSNRKPTIVLDYNVAPHYNYSKY